MKDTKLIKLYTCMRCGGTKKDIYFTDGGKQRRYDCQPNCKHKWEHTADYNIKKMSTS